jgi:hypothetical protein
MYFSSESLLVILFVGLVAGWLAGQIAQGTGFGVIGDMAIGIVDAFIGDLDVAASRYPGWFWNYRRHHRRHRAVAGNQVGPRWRTLEQRRRGWLEPPLGWSLVSRRSPEIAGPKFNKAQPTTSLALLRPTGLLLRRRWNFCLSSESGVFGQL